MIGLSAVGMSSLVWTPKVFEPSMLALSGYWRASYPGTSWPATPSAGVSGTTGSLVAGTAPPTGTAVNGYTPARYTSASSQSLVNSASCDGTIWTRGAGTCIVLFNAATSTAATGSIFNDVAIAMDTNAIISMTFTTSGIGGFINDGSYKLARVACGTGAWHLAMLRWNSSTIGITLDSAAETTTAAGAATSGPGTFVTGKYALGSAYFDGSILELATAAYAVTNGEYANIKSYVNTRYGLSL